VRRRVIICIPQSLGTPVRSAERQNAPFRQDFIQRVDDLSDRDGRIISVQEVEIDSISLEGIETLLKVGADVPGVNSILAPSIRVPAFRDDDHAVSNLRPPEPPPQNALTGSSAIVSCRVDAIAADNQPLVQQFIDELARKLVEIEGSKYEPRHFGAEARHLQVLHSVTIPSNS